MNPGVLVRIETDLSKLGVRKAQDRMAFYRGAIFAALNNARLARRPEGKALIKAIGPIARKHLGVGLKLEGAKATLRMGRDWQD